MYHFAKLDNNTWYLIPHTDQDVLDHFNKVLKREFIDGLEDKREGTYVRKDPCNPDKSWVMLNHPSSHMRIAVEARQYVTGESWVEAATRLEDMTLQDRMKMLEQGKTLFLSNGLTYLTLNEKNPMQIVDETWKDELVYPLNKGQYDYDKVEYYQNADGRWEARVGDVQVIDKRGRSSWSIKAYAKEMARCFCDGMWKNE